MCNYCNTGLLGNSSSDAQAFGFRSVDISLVSWQVEVKIWHTLDACVLLIPCLIQPHLRSSYWALQCQYSATFRSRSGWHQSTINGYLFQPEYWPIHLCYFFHLTIFELWQLESQRGFPQTKRWWRNCSISKGHRVTDTAVSKCTDFVLYVMWCILIGLWGVWEAFFLFVHSLGKMSFITE